MSLYPWYPSPRRMDRDLPFAAAESGRSQMWIRSSQRPGVSRRNKPGEFIRPQPLGARLARASQTSGPQPRALLNLATAESPPLQVQSTWDLHPSRTLGTEEMLGTTTHTTHSYCPRTRRYAADTFPLLSLPFPQVLAGPVERFHDHDRPSDTAPAEWSCCQLLVFPAHPYAADRLDSRWGPYPA